MKKKQWVYFLGESTDSPNSVLNMQLYTVNSLDNFIQTMNYDILPNPTPGLGMDKWYVLLVLSEYGVIMI